MGKMQRTKGAGGEREVVNIVQDAGFHAKRISMMETGGIDKGDVEVFEYETGQVKRGMHVPKFIYKSLEGYDYLFTRRDRSEWLVTLPLKKFLVIMQKAFLDKE